MRDAIERVMHWSSGQPWLVNRIGREVCFEMEHGRVAPEITVELIDEAVNRIIISNETHLDSLTTILREPRVRAIIEPMIIGANSIYANGDLEYASDLGLISIFYNVPKISNNIYKEVISRSLSKVDWLNSRIMSQIPKQSFYLNINGSINVTLLLRDFFKHFRENVGFWRETEKMIEAAPHLIFYAYLQRIVNSGGRVIRECALGNFYVDIRTEMPLNGGNLGFQGTKKQLLLFEVKLCSASGERVYHRHFPEEDLEQVYLQYRNSSPIDVEEMEAHLVVFDEHAEALQNTTEGYFYELKKYKDVNIHCWCCHSPKENRKKELRKTKRKQKKETIE